MKICDHVTEKCFEPIGAWKEPCPHAVAHNETTECKGRQCQRFAIPDGNMKLHGIIFINHTEIE